MTEWLWIGWCQLTFKYFCHLWFDFWTFERGWKTNYLEKSDSKNEIYHPTFFHISTQLKVVMRCQKTPSQDLTQINFNNHLRVTVHFFEKCHNFSTRKVIKSNIHIIIHVKKLRFLYRALRSGAYVWNLHLFKKKSK